MGGKWSKPTQAHPSRIERPRLESTPTPSFQVARREYSRNGNRCSQTLPADGSRAVDVFVYADTCVTSCPGYERPFASIRQRRRKIRGLPEAVFQPVGSRARRKRDSHSSVLSLFIAAPQAAVPPVSALLPSKNMILAPVLPAVTPRRPRRGWRANKIQRRS